MARAPKMNRHKITTTDRGLEHRSAAQRAADAAVCAAVDAAGLLAKATDVGMPAPTADVAGTPAVTFAPAHDLPGGERAQVVVHHGRAVGMIAWRADGEATVWRAVAADGSGVVEHAGTRVEAVNRLLALMS